MSGLASYGAKLPAADLVDEMSQVGPMLTTTGLKTSLKGAAQGIKDATTAKEMAVAAAELYDGANDIKGAGQAFYDNVGTFNGSSGAQRPIVYQKPADKPSGDKKRTSGETPDFVERRGG